MSLLSSRASQLVGLTCSLGRLSLQKQSNTAAAAVASSTTRFFGSKKKKGGPPSPHILPSGDPAAPAQQHLEWVQFQKSIAVEGFDTGQTTTTQSTRKQRGGRKTKRLSKKDQAMEDAIKERERQDVKGGEFPPLRYSPEETESLLKQAYNAIPKRMGKRGTRALKRQKLRFALVRNIHKKYKAHMAAFQIRKMQKRSDKIKGVMHQLKISPEQVQRDKAYQLSVYERWTAQIETPREEMMQEAELIGEENKVSG